MAGESVKNIAIKWKITVPIILIMLFVGTAYGILMGIKVKDVSIEQGKKDMSATSETVFGMMTEYMVAGTISERKNGFLEHMNKMFPVRMIAGDILDKQFGRKPADEYPRDDAEREVFRTGKPVFRIEEINGEPFLRGIFPYVNVTNYMGTNCVGCHNQGAKEGDILGALSIAKSIKDTEVAVRKAQMLIAAVTVLFSLLTIAVVYIISDLFLARPLTAVKEFVESAAHKDFSKRLNIKYHDDIGALSESILKMTGEVARAIKDVAGASSDISKNAGMLKMAIDESIDGTNRQSQQISQIATAAEEMSNTVAEIARNSITASESSNETLAAANKGKEIVVQSVEKINSAGNATQELSGMIEKLNSSITEIGEIVSVINDIADQTNLLALNAAIEAARAGEQGRGFAVVADEVRKLAERTMKATAEISGKIASVQGDSKQTALSMEKSLNYVNEGIQFMEMTKESLDTMVNSVRTAADKVSQIAASVEGQSAASEEIARSIEDISTIAKKTQESTEGLKAIFDTLNGLSQRLTAMVDEFKFLKKKS
ncbi:MAG TPA: methyl-accepting chemotaxis protein [Dissulfurispiraceae bacterium]